MQKRNFFDTLAIPIIILGILLTTTAFVLAFTTAHVVFADTKVTEIPELIGGENVYNKLLFSQKIFYFHVPVAISSFAALLFTAIYGVLFLVTRERRFDIRAKVATEIALVCVLATMASGVLWTRCEWGRWWVWEPRLTTYFILMLMVIGYFVLRNSIEDPEKRALSAAVFGIITSVNAPICFAITRLVPQSRHPVILRADSGLTPDMLLPFLLALFGMFCVVYGLYRFRLREQQLHERLEALKERLED